MNKEDFDLEGLEVLPYVSTEEPMIKKSNVLSLLTIEPNKKVLSIEFGLFRSGNKASDDYYMETFVFDRKPTIVYFSFLKTYLRVLKDNGFLFGTVLIKTQTSEIKLIIKKEESA
jgi:hypothetical protein